MALRFVFDIVENARARDTINGLEIVRVVKVFDIPREAAGAAYRALPAILAHPQCPKLHTAFPDPTLVGGVQLEERNLVTLESQKRHGILELVYRGGTDEGGGGGSILWAIEDSPVISHVLTNITADLQRPLTVWYKAGSTGSTIDKIDETVLTGYTVKGMQVHKVSVDRAIRVTGRATRAQWNAYRPSVLAARGTINSVPWGGYPRGEWLFVGPTSRTIDRGNTWDIMLEFWWKRGGHFAVGWYTDEFGNIPKDAASEQTLRASGPPPFGHYFGNNGVMLASVQLEWNFTALFAFTPDQPPSP